MPAVPPGANASLPTMNVFNNCTVYINQRTCTCHNNAQAPSPGSPQTRQLMLSTPEAFPSAQQAFSPQHYHGLALATEQSGLNAGGQDIVQINNNAVACERRASIPLSFSEIKGVDTTPLSTNTASLLFSEIATTATAPLSPRVACSSAPSPSCSTERDPSFSTTACIGGPPLSPIFSTPSWLLRIEEQWKNDRLDQFLANEAQEPKARPSDLDDDLCKAIEELTEQLALLSVKDNDAIMRHTEATAASFADGLEQTWTTVNDMLAVSDDDAIFDSYMDGIFNEPSNDANDATDNKDMPMEGSAAALEAQTQQAGSPPQQYTAPILPGLSIHALDTIEPSRIMPSVEVAPGPPRAHDNKAGDSLMAEPAVSDDDQGQSLEATASPFEDSKALQPPSFTTTIPPPATAGQPMPQDQAEPSNPRKRDRASPTPEQPCQRPPIPSTTCTPSDAVVTAQNDTHLTAWNHDIPHSLDFDPSVLQPALPENDIASLLSTWAPHEWEEVSALLEDLPKPIKTPKAPSRKMGATALNGGEKLVEGAVAGRASSSGASDPGSSLPSTPPSLSPPHSCGVGIARPRSSGYSCAPIVSPPFDPVATLRGLSGSASSAYVPKYASLLSRSPDAAIVDCTCSRGAPENGRGHEVPHWLSAGTRDWRWLHQCPFRSHCARTAALRCWCPSALPTPYDPIPRRHERRIEDTKSQNGPSPRRAEARRGNDYVRPLEGVCRSPVPVRSMTYSTSDCIRPINQTSVSTTPKSPLHRKSSEPLSATSRRDLTSAQPGSSPPPSDPAANPACALTLVRPPPKEEKNRWLWCNRDLVGEPGAGTSAAKNTSYLEARVPLS